MLNLHRQYQFEHLNVNYQMLQNFRQQMELNKLQELRKNTTAYTGKNSLEL